MKPRQTVTAKSERRSDACQCPWCGKWFSARAVLGKVKRVPWTDKSGTRLVPRT